MEKKEMVKVEGSYSCSSSSSGFINNNPSLFSRSTSSSSVFDFSEVVGGADEKSSSSLGFMELLGVQDYYNSFQLFDSPHHHHHQACVGHNNNKTDDDAVIKKKTGKECAEVMPPATPNSSSISSASSHDEQHTQTLSQHQLTPDPDDHHHHTTDKQLKVKKTNQKRQREPRFAFMTKSEVDHLEDGYRWRKYGQKAVKNSPFPRSYYRCTTASCNVKKRVERSLNDPSVVVTTYEGQHTHPSPVMGRSSSIPPGTAFVASSLMPENYLSQYYHHHQQQRQHQQLLLLNTLSSLGLPTQEIRQHCNPAPPGMTTNASSFLTDHGLLQDVVPSHMLKEH